MQIVGDWNGPSILDKFSNLICGGHKDLIPIELGAILRATLIGGSVYVAEAEAEGVVGTLSGLALVKSSSDCKRS